MFIIKPASACTTSDGTPRLSGIAQAPETGPTGRLLSSARTYNPVHRARSFCRSRWQSSRHACFCSRVQGQGAFAGRSIGVRVFYGVGPCSLWSVQGPSLGHEEQEFHAPRQEARPDSCKYDWNRVS